MIKVQAESLYEVWLSDDMLESHLLTYGQVQEKGIKIDEIGYAFIEPIIIHLNDDAQVVFSNEVDTFTITYKSKVIFEDYVSEEMQEYLYHLDIFQKISLLKKINLLLFIKGTKQFALRAKHIAPQLCEN